MIQPAPPTRLPSKLTAENRKDLPEDGRRWEIIEGMPVMSPAPSTRHQRIQMELIAQLLPLRALGQIFCAPVDVVLSDDTVVQPDIVFVRAERASIIEDDAIQGAPDLVIEILSPSTRRRDVLVKAPLFERTGVGAYWIVDPDLDRIEVYARGETGWRPPVIGASPELFAPPGLDVKLALREVFGR